MSVLVSLIIMTDFACCCLKTAHGCICAGVLIPACKQPAVRWHWCLTNGQCDIQMQIISRQVFRRTNSQNDHVALMWVTNILQRMHHSHPFWLELAYIFICVLSPKSVRVYVFSKPWISAACQDVWRHWCCNSGCVKLYAASCCWCKSHSDLGSATQTKHR